MWHQQQQQLSHLVPDPDHKEELLGTAMNHHDNNIGINPFQLQYNQALQVEPVRLGLVRSSASQVSLSFGNRPCSLSGSTSIDRSHSLGALHQPSGFRRASANSSRSSNISGNSNSNGTGTMMNETFRFPSPGFNAHGGGVHQHQQHHSGNPFLENPQINPVLAAAQLSVAAAQVHQAQANMARTTRRPSIPTPVQVMPTATLTQRMNMNGGGGPLKAFSAASSADEGTASSAHGHHHHSAAVSVSAPSPTPEVIMEAIMGPSELYRLIASPHEDAVIDWDVILNRARSHPREACFYDPNAGGHVYALHRLLRRTGDSDDEEGCSSRCRPPVEVVEAIMQACPRAVTRKQAAKDEDNLMMDDSNCNINNSSLGGNTNGMDWLQAQPQPNMQGGQRQQQQQVRNMLLNLGGLDNIHEHEGPDNDNQPQEAGQGQDDPQGEEEDEDRQEEEDRPNDNDGADHDDVQFEYPLAIACECEQDIEIVRLLASYLAKTKPVYRSEVFRSLDYASLPNPVVRILLEEYAGCVLERGMNSEATEGDDDDCPLEQVLFWWDDPDMMGMEDEIMDYPQCNMRHDLCDLWEKLRMMLYAATMGSMGGYDESKESFQVLHHVLRIVSDGGIRDVRFPNDFAHAVLLLAKFIQREKVSMFEERDESGSLPLHIAVSGEGLLRPDEPRQERFGGRGEEGQDGNDQENDDQQDNEEDVMDDVVQNAGGPAGDEEAQQQVNNGPLPPQAEARRAGYNPPDAAAQQAEEDEEDEDEEGVDNAQEDEDIAETSTMPSDMEIVRLLLDQHPSSIRLRDSQSGSLPVHLALQHNPRATEAIEHFLNLYPRSVTMPDGNGRLPLHLALIQESPTWNKVLSLSPTTLEARDPVTGLLPFQLAAMFKPEVSKDDDNDKTLKTKSDQQDSTNDEQRGLNSLSTAFQLLRMSPVLASGLGSIEPRKQSLIEQQIMVRYKPRVTKLEEENERLRRRVEELEMKLLSMQMNDNDASDHESSGRPSLKKRKPSSMDF